jgi:hypothetical protein
MLVDGSQFSLQRPCVIDVRPINRPMHQGESLQGQYKQGIVRNVIPLANIRQRHQSPKQHKNLMFETVQSQRWVHLPAQTIYPAECLKNSNPHCIPILPNNFRRLLTPLRSDSFIFNQVCLLPIQSVINKLRLSHCFWKFAHYQK